MQPFPFPRSASTVAVSLVVAFRPDVPQALIAAYRVTYVVAALLFNPKAVVPHGLELVATALLLCRSTGHTDEGKHASRENSKGYAHESLLVQRSARQGPKSPVAE